MQTRPWREFNLSRMMLGTAQFGLPYGIANKIGQPAPSDVRQIITAAVEGGVNCFDTAAAYGNSQEVLGQALRDLSLISQVFVVTKIRPLTPDERADYDTGARAVEQCIADSRQKLTIDRLPLVLFHREADLIFMPVLERLKERGWLSYAGISCDPRSGPRPHLASAPGVCAMQIPASILDLRHHRGGLLAAAAAQGHAVFTRSVYLQGLAVMPESQIPPPLHPVVPVRRALTAIASTHTLTLPELALRYMLAQPQVTCVLTGVESVEQTRQNISLFARGPLPAPICRQIQSAVPDLPELIVNPSLWPPRA